MFIGCEVYKISIMESFIYQLQLSESLISVIINSVIITFVLGFIFGYAISFIYGIKKTLKICLFIVILTDIIILSYTTSFEVKALCFNEFENYICGNTTQLMQVLPFMGLLLLSHLFINIAIGYAGVMAGIGFYYPSGWFLNKYFNINKLRRDTSDLETIVEQSEQITSMKDSVSAVHQKLNNKNMLMKEYNQ